MNKWTELMAGTIILVGIVLFTWVSPSWGSVGNFRHAAWEFLKGGIFWMVSLIGLLLVLLGINDVKNN